MSMQSTQVNPADEKKPSFLDTVDTNEAAAPMSEYESERMKAEKLRNARAEAGRLRRERGKEQAPVDGTKIEVGVDPSFTLSRASDRADNPTELTNLPRSARRGSSAASDRETLKARLKKQHILDKWPVLVWGVALVLAMLVHFGFVKEDPASGEVERATHILPASDTGIVTSVSVTQWERIESGQELLVISSRKLEENLNELDARLATRLLDLQTSSRIRIADLEIRIQERTIELEALEKERKILSDQVNSMNAMLAAEAGNPLVARFLQQGDFTRELAEASSDLIKVESKIAKETIARERDRTTIAAVGNEPQLLQPAEAALVATAEEARERSHLQEQLAALVVRSPVSGYVAALNRSLGERVEDGEALLEIVEDPRLIRVKVPSERAGALKAGSLLWIQRIDDPTRVFESPVLKMAPLILAAESRLSDRVQEVCVACPENAGFLPGQEVRAYLDNPDDPRFVVFGREFRRSFAGLSGKH